jgi:hypothetical protein
MPFPRPASPLVDRHTLVESRFPATRNQGYDTRYIFGPEFIAWRAALAAALALQGPASIRVSGDSMFEGFGPTVAANRPMTYLQSAIRAIFRPGGEGWVPAAVSTSGSNAANPRFTYSGTTDFTDYDLTLGRQGVILNSLNASATITFTGDRAWVLYTTGVGFGNLRVTVDGVILGTINTWTNTTSKSGRVFDTGLLAGGPNATHTLVVSAPGGAPANLNSCILDGVMLFSTDGGPAQAFADGVGNGTTTFVSGGAQFTAADAGKTINIDGVGTRTISSVTNATTVVLNSSVATNPNAGAQTYSWNFTSKRANSTGGVRLWNTAHSGYQASAFPAGEHWDAVENILPGLLIIEFGLNDMLAGISQAQYYSDLFNIVSAVSAKAGYQPSVVLVPMWAIATTKASSFTDGVNTSGTNVLSSRRAWFDSTDVGKTITGTGIPASTTITAVTEANPRTNTPAQATLSNTTTQAVTSFAITSRTAVWQEKEWLPYRETNYRLARR